LSDFAAATDLAGAATNGRPSGPARAGKAGSLPSERKAKRSKREDMGGDGVEPPTSWV
jgi:hypothetical protein